jgi:hypothetical protein
MGRDPTYRASKYAAKIVGDVIKNRIDAQKDSMVSQATTQFGLIAAKEDLTKSKLVGWGVSTLHVPFYLSFARQLYGITKKHSGQIAENEACLATAKWGSTQRGLNMYYLQTIAQDVFDLDVAACT